MSTGNSITRLLSGVKKADEEAVGALFDKYYRRIVELAGRNLGENPQRVFDADDVANAAFWEFLVRAAAGEFQRLENRKDVWQILAMLVGDKIAERLRHEGRLKRGGGRPPVTIQDVQHAICDLDDPALQVEVADARSRFLDSLPKDAHRDVVELLEQGHTHQEIAKKLRVSLRTVDRRLEVIRSVLPRVLGITGPTREPKDAQEESNGAEQ